MSRSLVRRALLGAWGAGALAACSLHGVQEEPAPPLPPAALYGTAGAQGPRAPELAWWSALGDPRLDGLVASALAANLDAARAVARVARAEALHRQAGALDKPALDAVGEAGASWVEGEGTDTALLGGLGLAWEIDLFGRLRAEIRARGRELAATRDELAALRLLLTGQVAEAYLDAVEQQLQLRLLDEQTELARTLLELNRLRFSLGAASAVDVLQQRTQLEAVRAEVPRARAALRAAENRLDVLLGQAPDGRDRTAPASASLPELAPLPPSGVPADLLVQRPDLRALRDRVVAADHRVGGAIAERLPRISLTGSLGAVDDPSGSGLAASAAASLVQPLLDWGRRVAGVDEARADLREALLAFGQAYLVAVEEVDTLLWREARQRELIASLRERRGLLEQTVAESRNRFGQGLTDYLPVLTAVQALQQVQRELLGEQRELVSLRVRLHRALGGPVPEA